MASSEALRRRVKALEKSELAELVAVAGSITRDEWRHVFASLRASGFPFPELPPVGDLTAIPEAERTKIVELLQAIVDDPKASRPWELAMIRLRAQRRAVPQNVSKCRT
jgi:hypothetical protein